MICIYNTDQAMVLLFHQLSHNAPTVQLTYFFTCLMPDYSICSSIRKICIIVAETIYVLAVNTLYINSVNIIHKKTIIFICIKKFNKFYQKLKTDAIINQIKNRCNYQ